MEPSFFFLVFGMLLVCLASPVPLCLIIVITSDAKCHVRISSLCSFFPRIFNSSSALCFPFAGWRYNPNISCFKTWISTVTACSKAPRWSDHLCTRLNSSLPSLTSIKVDILDSSALSVLSRFINTVHYNLLQQLL
jgi:hypothetical protein